MAHPNEDLARKGYDAFAKGDVSTLRKLLAEDVVWHTAGRNPLAGDYRGIDETLQSFARIAELTGGTFKIDVHDVLANDEHVIVLGRASAQRDGKSLDEPFVQVAHAKDGKLTESWIQNVDQYAVDDFLS